MSNAIRVLSDVELSSITGGHHDENPFGLVGSNARCAFLKNEIQSRKDLIANDAVRGTIGGSRELLTPRIYGNGAILSRDQREYNLRCRGSGDLGGAGVDHGG